MTTPAPASAALPAPSVVSVPKSGDVFAFRGLDGDDLDGRTVTVRSISVSGRVAFQVGFLGTPARGLHDAPLTDVLAMIGAGIWVAASSDDHASN